MPPSDSVSALSQRVTARLRFRALDVDPDGRLSAQDVSTVASLNAEELKTLRRSAAAGFENSFSNHYSLRCDAVAASELLLIRIRPSVCHATFTCLHPTTVCSARSHSSENTLKFNEMVKKQHSKIHAVVEIAGGEAVLDVDDSGSSSSLPMPPSPSLSVSKVEAELSPRPSSLS